jgi:creatinine amidohydrolase
MPTYWEDLNWSEFQSRVPAEFATAIIPIGTIEAHGVGPMGTDNFIPIDMVNEIADELNALVCPPIHYGQVRGLAGYPGGVPVEESTLLAYCRDVFVSIADWGFDSLVVINGHGGNTRTLKEAAWAVHAKTGIKVLVIDWWDLAMPVCEEVYGQAGGHAGCDENGYVQAIRPDTIHPELLTNAHVYNFNPGVATYPYPGTVLTSKEGQGAPVFDDEKAQRYREGAIRRVLEFCMTTLAQWKALGI